eukprot:TRINITY_DN5601_c0_g1_i1.p1 TRINITY_DN5601_c0_g1~~TRINITY_DN5601_c0_g1_i1.p1  ORF type:complete len:309 (-),score=75.41 TRINITY_DN5601_c0_g1_i1:1002-1928(-)
MATVAPVCNNNPWREWRSASLPCGRGWKLSVEGYSRAADKTFLYVRELRLALDAGVCGSRTPPWVFVTHAHEDHIGDMPFMAKRKDGVVIFCPDKSKEALEALVRATVKANLCNFKGDGWREDLFRCKFHGLKPGEVFEIPEMGSMGASVEVFECFHSAPCIGYGVSLRKKRLAARMQGKPGKEIAAARARGEVVDEVVLEPVFAFLGDTTVEAFTRSPRILEFPVVITECSHIPVGADEEVESKRDKHTHWNDLSSIVEAHPNTTFVLIHWSLRYTIAEIENFFGSLPSPPKNVVLFLNDRKGFVQT